jgi:hypothetical protein
MYHQNNQSWKPTEKWEIETPKEATDCSFCDLDIKPQFVLTPKIMGVVQKLCVEIKREWQILLIGEETATGIVCYGYYVPEQETGYASVKNLDEIDLTFVKKRKIVATIHSHGDIGVSFSSTDDQCTNHSFIKHHIVTNNSGDFMAISRIVLPCKLIKFAKASVTIKVPEIKEVKGIEKIKESSYVTTTYPTITNHNGSTEGITWKYGDARHHAFEFDQTEGGYCGL